MTSVVVWAGVDARAVASVYIGTDSLISWGNVSTWDQGRKTFACVSQPHIFGYWGDVLFPALALPLIAERIDNQVLGGVNANWSGWWLAPCAAFGKATRSVNAEIWE